RKEGEEALTDLRGEVEMGLIEYFDRSAAGVHTLHDCDAVHHGSGRSVPFREHQDVASAESVDCALEFRSTFYVPARGLFGEDDLAASCAQGAELPIEILLDRRHPGVADQRHKLALTSPNVRCMAAPAI